MVEFVGRGPLGDPVPPRTSGYHWLQPVSIPPYSGGDWGIPNPDLGFALNPFKDFFRGAVINVMNRMADAQRQNFQNMLNNVIGGLDMMIDGLMGSFNKVISEIGSKVQGAITSIQNEAAKMVNLLRTELTNLQNQLKGFIANATGEMKAALADARAQIEKAMNQAVAGINKTVADMRAQIEQTFKTQLADVKAQLGKIPADVAAELRKGADLMKSELEKARAALVLDIRSETTKAKDEITKTVNEQIARLPAEVARVTADLFQQRGLVVKGGGAPSGGGPAPSLFDFSAFKFPGMGSLERGFAAQVVSRGHPVACAFLRGIGIRASPAEAMGFLQGLFITSSHFEADESPADLGEMAGEAERFEAVYEDPGPDKVLVNGAYRRTAYGPEYGFNARERGDFTDPLVPSRRGGLNRDEMTDGTDGDEDGTGD